MSLFEELQKGSKVKLRLWDYLRWAVLAVLIAVVLVAAVLMGLLAIAGESASEIIENLLHHMYMHYGLIPVFVLLAIAVVAAVAFVVQLAFTYLVFWKAYAEKRGGGSMGSDRPALLAKTEKKSGWTKGYYQGVVLLATNLVIAVFLVAGIVYAVGYVGVGVAEQPAFCTMCHEVMAPPYESYMASTHKGIPCGKCHNDPGVKGFIKGEVIAPMKEGWLQVAEEYHLDEPFLVPINNHSCLNAECHKEERLRAEEFRHGDMVYRHEKHLDLKHDGELLACDACHAYDKEVHMAVDYMVCGLCHFSKNYTATKGLVCSACHAARPEMKEARAELIHREVSDFEHHTCNECHEITKSDIVIQPGACAAKCHHHHGKKEKKLEPGKSVHHLHKHAKCMSCHVEVQHRIGDEKFRTQPRSPFGKKFVHRGHLGIKCTECHSEERGHFVQKLKSRKDCNTCHHEGVDDPESCGGCHEKQQELYEGAPKFGMEKTPSVKFEAEMTCDSCHGDVQSYMPEQCQKSCSECHDEGDMDYDYKKLLASGSKALADARKQLRDLKARLEVKVKADPGSEDVRDAREIMDRAQGMIMLLDNDGSYGLHNPGLFGEYLGKIGSLLKAAKDLMK